MRRHHRRIRRPHPLPDAVQTESAPQGVPMRPTEAKSPVLRKEKKVYFTPKMFQGLPEFVAKHALAWLGGFAPNGDEDPNGMKRNTVKSYLDAVATFATWFRWSSTHLNSYNEFSDYKAKAFIDYLVQKGSKPRSIGLKRAALKAFWDYLKRHGETKSNPFDQVSVPTPISVPKHPFSELEDMDMIQRFYLAGKWYPVLLLMRFAGLRLSEILSLSSANIHWSGNGRILRIEVKSGNGMDRWAAMLPDDRFREQNIFQNVVWKVIKARWWDKVLFETGKGGLYSTYKTMIKHGYLPDGFSPNRLRQTFVSWLRTGGCREATVAALLGHEDIQTKMYGPRMPEDVEGHFLKEWRGSGR